MAVSSGCSGSETTTSSQTSISQTTTQSTSYTTSSTATQTTSSTIQTTTQTSTQTTTTQTTTTGKPIIITPTQIVAATGDTGFLSSQPARIGVTVEGTMAVLPFSQYPSLEATGELYTEKITLLEIMRGENAFNYLTDFGIFSGFPFYKNPPEAGYECVLVTIKFEYYMRDLPGNLIYKMAQGDFMTYSQDGVEYSTPYILPWRTDDMWNYDITPGDVLEIKIFTIVKTDDQKPVMLFKKGEKWLGLY